MDKPLPFEAMQSGWAVLKKWCSCIEDIKEDDWDTMINETREIWLRSGKDELVMDMVCAFLKEIERRYENVKSAHGD